MSTIYNSAKAKRNSHTDWQYAQYITIRVNMERVFEVTVEFIPCNKTVTALEMAKLYLFHVWKNHSLPHTIVSDHGPQFAS